MNIYSGYISYVVVAVISTYKQVVTSVFILLQDNFKVEALVNNYAAQCPLIYSSSYSYNLMSSKFLKFCNYDQGKLFFSGNCCNIAVLKVFKRFNYLGASVTQVFERWL